MYLIQATRDTLNGIMEFDHVIRVYPDGTVSDTTGEYAPELHDDVLSPSDAGWSLMTGYTGQHGYSGPIMHDSESIGGNMAEDILAQPGLYVAVLSYYTEKVDSELQADDGSYIEGWAVAYKADRA